MGIKRMNLFARIRQRIKTKMSTTIVNKEGDYLSTETPIVGTLRYALSLPTPRRIIITVKDIILREMLYVNNDYTNIQSAVGTTIKASPQIVILSNHGIFANITVYPTPGNWRPIVFAYADCKNWLVKDCVSVANGDDGFNMFEGPSRIQFDRCVFKGTPKGSLVDSNTTNPCTNITYSECLFKEVLIRTPNNSGQGIVTVRNCQIYVTQSGLETQRLGSQTNIINNTFYNRSSFDYYPSRIQDIPITTPNVIYSEGNKWYINGVEQPFKVGQAGYGFIGGLPISDLMYSLTPFPCLLPDLTGVPV